MYLHIKGNRHEAEQAAIRHSITELSFIDERNGQTVLQTDCFNRGAVIKWFLETGTEGPFAIGTLLWYNDGRKER